jgi:hypothetical protein
MADTNRRAAKTSATRPSTTRRTTRATPAKTRKAPVRPTETKASRVAPRDTTAVVAAGSRDLGNGGSRDLAADVSGQLRDVAPTFGQVLAAIGQSVAASQAALDSGAIDTVKELVGTKISVVTDVIQYLDDDGQPETDKTDFISSDQSVLSYFMPPIHEWKSVNVSMDLSVGAFSESDGVQFTSKQSTTGQDRFLLWGFLSITSPYRTTHTTTQSVSRQSTQDMSWSQGEVRLDATLGPRQTASLPAPAQVTIGPTMSVSQGPVKEVRVPQSNSVNRSIDVTVTLRGVAGNPIAGKTIEVDGGGLRTSSSGDTSTKGVTTLTVTRNVANSGVGPARVPVILRYNQVVQTVTVTI